MWIRCLPDSPVLLGWFAQNGLQKRIEASERNLPLPPVVGRVAEDVEQLLARLFVKLGVGRNVLEYGDKAGLRARFVYRVGHAVVERVKVLARRGGERELCADQVEHVLLGLGAAQISVQKVVPQTLGSFL